MGAGSELGDVGGGDLAGGGRVQEVQHHGRDQADGFAQVDQAGCLYRVQDGGGLGYVPGHRVDVVLAAGGQRPQVVDYDRVVVHIDHRCGGVVAVDDVVYGRGGGQPGPQVGVLADGLGGHVVQGADQEPAVFPDHLPDTGVEGDQPSG